MIYKGKEYKVITREGAKIGDLVHITALDDNDCDIHEFITWIDDEYDIHFNHYLPDGSYFVYKGDTFKTYRYVKDVEETPVKFKSGDRVRLTEFELNGQINFGNFNGYVGGEKFDGDYKVKFDDGAFGFFPPTSLELIEEKPAPKEKNIPPTDSLRYSAFNTPAYKLKRSIKKLYEEMSELITAKNENYGDSFSKQYQKYGMVSVEMRLNDKMLRLEQLVKGEKDKVGESVEDTLKDIIGYATLALIELEGVDNES